MKGITAIRGTAVYIVLEHHTDDADAIVHGVYSNKATAYLKRYKVLGQKHTPGYISILKKTIEGKKERVDHIVCKEYNIDEYRIENN